MNLQPKQVKIGFIMLSILCISIFVFVFFLKYLPAKQDGEQIDVNISQERRLMEALSKRSQDKNKGAVKSTFMLQKKIPVDPMIEQFLLDIQKAEVMGNSLVTSITIDEGSDFVPHPVTEGAEVTPDKQVTTPVEPQKNTTAPQGMKRILLNLNVESETYEQLQQFVRTLESGERIAQVNTISIAGQSEVTASTTEVNDKMAYTLSVSAFYMPALKDLEEQMPKVEVPKGCNKTNPFVEGVCDDEE